VRKRKMDLLADEQIIRISWIGNYGGNGAELSMVPAIQSYRRGAVMEKDSVGWVDFRTLKKHKQFWITKEIKWLF
jgi:hypothetical protein